MLRILLALTFTLGLAASPAAAALLDFDLTWETIGFFPPNDDSAQVVGFPQLTATGTIRIDDQVLPNPQSPAIFGSAASLGIVDFSILIEGASFGLSDFDSFVWGTGPLGLDLGQELVGQSTGMGTWGVDAGDFNMFAGGGVSTGLPSGNVPTGITPFHFLSGNQNVYQLTSFRPVQGPSDAIPEPSAALLYAGGLLTVATRVRRKQRASREV